MYLMDHNAGADYTSPQGMALVGSISTGREKIADLLGVPRHGENATTALGNVVEKDPAGPSPHLGTVSQGDVKTSLQTESAKQVYLNVQVVLQYILAQRLFNCQIWWFL